MLDAFIAGISVGLGAGIICVLSVFFIGQRRSSESKKRAEFEARLQRMPTIPVPQADFELVKQIRLIMANKDTFVLCSADLPEEVAAQRDHINAKILHDYYGLTSEEVLQYTGFWVD